MLAGLRGQDLPCHKPRKPRKPRINVAKQGAAG